MATVKKISKAQSGKKVASKKDDFATVMGKTLNSTTPGAPGYKPTTGKEKTQMEKQRVEMKKKSAAGKAYKSGGKVAKTPAQKKFAALAAPKNKITFADKLAGIKKKKK